MSAAPRAPVWREIDAGTVWHPHVVWRARLNGWKLDVAQSRTPGGNQWWHVFAEHRDGERVFNSAWSEVRKAWTTQEAAKRAAERGAREGWEWLKSKT